MMTTEELHLFPREDALVIRTGAFEILLKYGPTYGKGFAVGLVVRVVEDEISKGTAWIILNELCAKVGRDEEECHLECLKSYLDCDHGSYDASQYSSGGAPDTNKRPKRGMKRRCDKEDYCPPLLAIHVIQHLHPVGEETLSPIAPT